MSALRENQGCFPDPIEATTPVLATGHEYSIPSESSSDLIICLVLCSSNASSGYSWILLLTLLIHPKNSASFVVSISNPTSDPKPFSTAPAVPLTNADNINNQPQMNSIPKSNRGEALRITALNCFNF